MAAIESIAPKLGCVPQTLLEWVKQAEVDAGARPGVSTAEAQRIQGLEREVKELRRANEILMLASAVLPKLRLRLFFCPDGARPPVEVMFRLVEEHRDVHGIAPICRILQIAPSAYRRHAALRRNPSLASPRSRRDSALMPRIEQVWNANF